MMAQGAKTQAAKIQCPRAHTHAPAPRAHKRARTPTPARPNAHPHPRLPTLALLLNTRLHFSCAAPYTAPCHQFHYSCTALTLFVTLLPTLTTALLLDCSR